LAKEVRSWGLARALAEDALKAAGVTAPPVDLDDVARVRALRIERHVHLAPPLRGAFQAHLGLIQVIDLPPTVERFPVAHEIGHALLNDAGTACTEAMIRGQADSASLAEILEGFDPEATPSAIASRLLVPSAWLRREVDRRTFDDLLDLFDVTKPVMLIAVMRDGLLNRVRTS
jgi:hypothetical protein